MRVALLEFDVQRSRKTLYIQRFSGDFNDNFGACVKIYVQIEWEFPRMCENWR
jgi:hypothetical protein